MLILLLSLFQPASADTLDLETAIRLASEQALDASSAELAVARQDAEYTAARRAWSPSLDLRASGQGSLGRTFAEQLGVNITEPVAALSTSLVASMPLYQGGALRAGREGALASLDASLSDEDQTRDDLHLLAADSLLAVAQAQDALDVQLAALEADHALLLQVSLQVDAGTRTLADQHSQQAVASSRTSSVASARQALQAAELSLLAVLRLDPQLSWTFRPPPELGEVGHEEDLITMALEHRPALKATQERVAASEAYQREVRGAYLPSVSLSAGASTSWLSSDPAPLTSQLDTQSRTWMSVDLSMPLLSAGVRRSRVDLATVALGEARVEQQRTQDEVALAIRLLLADEQAARASLAAFTVAAQAAEQAAEVRTVRYQAGADTLVDLTQARADLVDAQLQLAQAASDLQRVRYQLSWATGQL